MCMRHVLIVLLEVAYNDACVISTRRKRRIEKKELGCGGARSAASQLLFLRVTQRKGFFYEANVDILSCRRNAILEKLLLESAERETTCMISCTSILSVLPFMKERGMMSQQRRLIPLSLIGTILLCLLVGMYLVVRKRFSKPDPSAKVIRHSVKTPADDVLKYWTADKMHNAKAADMPKTDDLKPGKKQPRHPTHTSDTHDA